MSAEKVYIQANPDGKISIGNQVIELKDDSKKTFKTDNLLAFEAFCTGRAGEVEIYYSESEVSLVPVEASKNFKVLASCTLKSSAPLASLKAAAGKDLEIVEFEKLLTSLRKYANGSHLTVISQLRNFTVAKKQTYERATDNAGNYKLLIQREASNGDWTPPATMAFRVPLFAFLPETIDLEFDLIFTMSAEDRPIFRLENLTVAQEITDRRVAVLDARLGAVSTCPKYWGTVENYALTDSWRFQENKASL